MDFLIENIDLFVDAMGQTLLISLFAGLLALVLGTLLAAMRVSPVPPLRGLANFYVEVFRNTPLTVVFFFIIFGLPQIDTVVSPLPGAILSVGLYTAAFVCEAIRSGINSISAGQAEAARAIGLTFSQSLREVVLPQAFRTVVPPLGNVWIAMVKNTSIAAGFFIPELSSLLPRLANAAADELIATLIGIVFAYLLITLPSAYAVSRLEKRAAILR
ncbi:MAG: amino acid ABC transporter permease [Actinomycetota bacterium]|nr:amino acid ABC transporter permease [Actinomycetota bacterium]